MTNRTIKFRAWDGKKWVYGTPEFGDMGQLYIISPVGNKDLCERDTLGQLIGLTDKNGKEIYEGDIVARSKSAVTFREVKFEASYTRNGWNIACGENFEVIGNIYENSDLLK